MDKAAASSVYLKLRTDVRRYDYHYHALGEPLVSDDVYNALRKQVNEIESQFPDLATELGVTSPNELVGYTPAGGRFERVRHGFPMQSLDNTFTVEDVIAWLDKLPLPVSVIIETKLDGLSLSLVYIDGTLTRAISRGDGEIGEDVTSQVWAIAGIPYTLRYEGSDAVYRGVTTVRGEVVVHTRDFLDYNRAAELTGKKKFANTRNMAAGSMRLQDSKELDRRKLRFYTYSVDFIGGDSLTHTDDMIAVSNMGFVPAPSFEYTGEWKDAEYIAALLKDFETDRPNYPFEIDGMVFKVDEYAVQEVLGARSASPRWATAWKFPAEEKQTKLEKVDFQIGRSGVLTPVARIEPVFVCGVTVSNITLHNLDEIRRLDLHDDDYVSIRRAGDVIPQIVCAIPHMRKQFSYSVSWPQSCPVCNFPTKIVTSKKEGSKLYCSNKGCAGKYQKLMEYQVERGCLNMEDFGPATVAAILDIDRYDIWDVLSWGDTELTKVEKSAVQRLKLVRAIERSRTQTLARVIMSLGIENCAEGTSERLARALCSWDRFWEATYDEIEAIADIGDVTATSIVKWREENSELRGKIFETIDIICPEPIRQTGMTGMSVVVTGSKFNGRTRKEVEALLKAQGAKPTKDVTTNTSFALFGTAYTQRKLDMAKAANIPYIVYLENGIHEQSETAQSDPLAG